MSVAAAASSTQRHKFIVYAPDFADEGALQRRLSVRSTHLDKAREQIAQGTISTFSSYLSTAAAFRTKLTLACSIAEVAGAMLTPGSIASPTAEKKMVGSVFICEAESVEAVRRLMENDVYYTSGVVSTSFVSGLWVEDTH